MIVVLQSPNKCRFPRAAVEETIVIRDSSMLMLLLNGTAEVVICESLKYSSMYGIGNGSRG
jgi:hypothetical protein